MHLALDTSLAWHPFHRSSSNTTVVPSTGEWSCIDRDTSNNNFFVFSHRWGEGHYTSIGGHIFTVFSCLMWRKNANGHDVIDLLDNSFLEKLAFALPRLPYFEKKIRTVMTSHARSPRIFPRSLHFHFSYSVEINHRA